MILNWHSENPRSSIEVFHRFFFCSAFDFYYCCWHCFSFVSLLKIVFHCWTVFCHSFYFLLANAVHVYSVICTNCETKRKGNGLKIHWSWNWKVQRMTAELRVVNLELQIVFIRFDFNLPCTKRCKLQKHFQIHTKY